MPGEPPAGHATRRVHLALGLLLLAAACRPSDPIRPAQEQRYAFVGIVVEVRPETQRVLVDHEAIPGLMSAMTMSFALREERLLGELRPGDRLSATLVVNGDVFLLEDISILGRRDESDKAPRAPTNDPPEQRQRP